MHVYLNAENKLQTLFPNPTYGLEKDFIFYLVKCKKRNNTKKGTTTSQITSWSRSWCKSQFYSKQNEEDKKFKVIEGKRKFYIFLKEPEPLYSHFLVKQNEKKDKIVVVVTISKKKV